VGKNRTRLTALRIPKMPQENRAQTPNCPKRHHRLPLAKASSQQPNPDQHNWAASFLLRPHFFRRQSPTTVPRFDRRFSSIRLEQLGLSNWQFLTIASFFSSRRFSGLVARALGDAIRRFSSFCAEKSGCASAAVLLDLRETTSPLGSRPASPATTRAIAPRSFSSVYLARPANPNPHPRGIPCLSRVSTSYPGPPAAHPTLLTSHRFLRPLISPPSRLPPPASKRVSTD
jgi:hypothetical protein